MINRQDCLLLLTEMQENGVDVKEQLSNVFNPQKMPEVVKYINEYRQLDLVAFYSKLRKSYNNKHSNLYINIMKEKNEPDDVLSTLASLQLQIILFAKNLENPQIFLRSSRSAEISTVLRNYFLDYDITKALQLLSLIKADVKVSEWSDGRKI